MEIKPLGEENATSFVLDLKWAENRQSRTVVHVTVLWSISIDRVPNLYAIQVQILYAVIEWNHCCSST